MPHSETLKPAVSRPWLLWIALSVGLSGCRSCEATSPKAKVIEGKEATDKKKDASDFLAESRAKRRAKRGKQGLMGLRESLGELEMTIPSAAEEVREVAEPVERARTLVLTGETGPATEARGLLTARLAEAPDDVDALYWMGRSYNAERIQVPAVDWYEKALLAEPDFVAAHRWLAFTYHAEGRCQDARPHLDAAVAARPKQADVHIDRAVCSMAVRDWDSVVVDLTAACALESFDWCEDVSKLADAEKRRAERLEQVRAMDSKVGKVRTGKSGRGKFGKSKFGKGKFGKGKFGQGQLKAQKARSQAGSETSEE